MDSAPQETSREDMAQTGEDEETPSTTDNLPKSTKHEDDSGAVLNPTFHNAGLGHVGMSTPISLSLAFLPSLLILDPEIYELKLDEAEIVEMPSSKQPQDDESNSRTREKNDELAVKHEDIAEGAQEQHTSYNSEVQSYLSAGQYTENPPYVLDERAVPATSAEDVELDEAHQTERCTTSFEHQSMKEESEEQIAEPTFFDNLPAQENNPFDYLDQEKGMNGLHPAENWPTEEPDGRNLQPAEDNSSLRNPFREPEFGQSIFGTGAFDQDDQLDPELQGYALLGNDDNGANNDPHHSDIGDTSADVHNAQGGDNFTSSPESKREGYDEDQVAAFSQAREPLSEGVTGLEFLAHQLVDPCDNIPNEMHLEMSTQKKRGDISGERWWSSYEDSEKFNFGEREERKDVSDLFEASEDISQHFPVKMENTQGDPFTRLLASNESQQASAPKGTYFAGCPLIVR